MEGARRVFMLLEGGDLQGYSRFRLNDPANIFWNTSVMMMISIIFVDVLRPHTFAICVP